MKLIAAEPIAALMWTLAACTACASSTSPAPEARAPAEQAPGAAPPDAAADVAREQLTAEECEANQGAVVGDIGDGAIHRPEYTCPSGKKPLGNIAAAGEPIAVEGAVCCPQ